MPLMRVRVDFNSLNIVGPGGLTDVVYFNTDKPNSENADFYAQMKEGVRVLLYQDDDDFEVEAVVERLRGQDIWTGRDHWYARPDWSTRRDFSSHTDGEGAKLHQSD